MKNSFLSPSLLTLLLAGASFGLQAEEPTFSKKQLDFFEKNIRPVLVARCYDCHSAEGGKTKGDLALDSREAMLRGGTGGPSIVPGDPSKGLFMEAIRADKVDLQMPPKGEPLTDAEVRNFEIWIRMGAPDPRKAQPGIQSLAGVPIEKGREHWAFQPVQNPEVPQFQGKYADWGHNAIDAFVLQKMLQKDLTPNQSATDRQWLRRVYFGLIGLPPTPEQVDRFLADKSPKARERVVDELLKSPHYGERWGRHWLDVARYADTNGDRKNQGEPAYPFAWTYRDYVINAMNEDKPFNQFLMEQIAADQLETSPDRHEMAALGFLTVGKRFQGSIYDIIDDRIDVVTQGFMALTVSCARCHDHKFDPVPTADYYSLYGVFASSLEPDEPVYIGDPSRNPHFEEYRKEVARLQEEMENIRPKLIDEELEKIRDNSADYLLATHEALQTKDLAKRRKVVNRYKLNLQAAETWFKGMEKVKSDHAVLGPWVKYSALGDDAFAASARKITREIQQSGGYNPIITRALVDAEPTSLKQVAKLYEGIFKEVGQHWEQTLERQAKAKRLSDPAEDEVRLVLFAENSPIMPSERDARRLVNNNLIRREEYRLQPKLLKLRTEHPGSMPEAMAMVDARKPRDANILIRGERTRRGDLVPRQFLEILSPEGREPFQHGSGRLDLARDIADPKNPLTPRVIVNRIWAEHFGQGLVTSISDFGLRAEAPSHPELLDYLATWFMENGWSLKKLHRMIVLSSTYNQASQTNEQFVEKDPANRYLWRWPVQRLDFEAIRDTLLYVSGTIDLSMGGRPVEITEKPFPVRRTVYAHIDRYELPDIFRTFDFANPDMTTSERIETTVPQQSLFLMNSPFVIEQARALVERSEISALSDPTERIQEMFELLYQREPSREELADALQFLKTEANRDETRGELAAWDYGYGSYTAGKGEVRFRPFKRFEQGAYSVTGRIPDPRFGNLSLDGDGGYVDQAGRMAVVRRWTASEDQTLSIRSAISHQAEEGNGVQAFILQGGQKVLAEARVNNDSKKLNLQNIEVKAGDTLDFVVLPLDGAKNDRFDWAPTLQSSDNHVWSAAKQYASPIAREATQALTSWDKLAQVLLMSNETLYLN